MTPQTLALYLFRQSLSAEEDPDWAARASGGVCFERRGEQVGVAGTAVRRAWAPAAWQLRPAKAGFDTLSHIASGAQTPSGSICRSGLSALRRPPRLSGGCWMTPCQAGWRKMVRFLMFEQMLLNPVHAHVPSPPWSSPCCCPCPPWRQRHVVKPGETLSQIAERYGVSTSRLNAGSTASRAPI